MEKGKRKGKVHEETSHDPPRDFSRALCTCRREAKASKATCVGSRERRSDVIWYQPLHEEQIGRGLGQFQQTFFDEKRLS